MEFCDTLEIGSLPPDELGVVVFNVLGLLPNKSDGAVFVSVLGEPAPDEVSLLPNMEKEAADCACAAGCVLEAAPNSGLACAADWFEPKSPPDALTGGGPAGVVETVPNKDGDRLLVGVEMSSVAFPNKLGV